MYTDPNLPRHISGWRSTHLGMEMPIVRYGERGHPLLIYPTAAADFLENERFWLVKSIEPFIMDGRIQVFSIDSINRHSWMSDEVSVPECGRRQALYSNYIEQEVVPYIRSTVGDPEARVAVSGASFGAFHAANQLFRRPDLFDIVIAMSGFFDLGPGYTHGYSDDNIYFNNPVAYLSNMGESDQLTALRERCQIHILTGQGQWEAPHRSVQLSEVLHRKKVPHNLDMWGLDVSHDWPWWRKMLPHYIGERVSL